MPSKWRVVSLGRRPCVPTHGEPRVALVHDYLNQYGGAERVLEELHALFPSAPVYTSMYWPEKMSPTIRALDVRTSFMQRLPIVTPQPPAVPAAVPAGLRELRPERLRRGHLATSSAFCKGVVTPPGTLHICYCLTPMRWVWNYHAYVERERLGHGGAAGAAGGDQPAAHRGTWPPPRTSIASWRSRETVAARIRKYYRRDATVIYPPVNCDAFTAQPARVDDYYLIVSRLIPYKRIDLAVDAFTRLGIRAEDRRQMDATCRRLRARAGRNVEFVGRVSDAELKELYAGCRGFVFPGEEDFGIAPARSQRQRPAGDRLRRRRGAGHGRRWSHGRAVRAASRWSA